MPRHFQSPRRRFFGWRRLGGAKGLFGSSAAISFGIIFLIFLFLVTEAVRFFPEHRRELQLARQSGQEYVDHLIREAAGYQSIVSLVNQAYYQEQEDQFGKELGAIEVFEIYQERIEEGCEAEAAALEEARETGGERLIEDARRTYEARVREVVETIPQEEIDVRGRLAGDDALWTRVREAALAYEVGQGEMPKWLEDFESGIEGGMARLDESRQELLAVGRPLKRLRDRLVKVASATRDEVQARRAQVEKEEALRRGSGELGRGLGEAEGARAGDNDFSVEKRAGVIAAAHGEHVEVAETLAREIEVVMEGFPDEWRSPEAGELIFRARAAVPVFVSELEESVASAARWRWDEPVGQLEALGQFFLGREWRTASDWRQLFGLLPLLSGSMIISLIAIVIAVPFSIGAAIYVNQLSTKFEQVFLKPAIEMIQAIPSIVLGFFGIMVLGNVLVEVSGNAFFSWLPGFPITERLNMLNAGILLALMAVPTIFTLCEDALNNVPRSYLEASMALGASRFQTVKQVVMPAAGSGMFAAVLLGLGRVIGETMVVLLVAGNKIALPDWGAGLGVVTQPAHTMTGIIAQEMGEVTVGTLHYRALFLIGLVLFLISLGINLLARHLVKRFQTDG